MLTVLRRRSETSIALAPHASSPIRDFLYDSTPTTNSPPSLLYSTMTKGKLIVFEGLDRAGKTTQCQMLVEALQKEGQSVMFMRFPGM
jgi:hypothetical protein